MPLTPQLPPHLPRSIVFHVVPHPSRLGHFTQVYSQALGTVPAAHGTHVIAFSGGEKGGDTLPSVSADVIAILPAGEFVEEWWLADHERADIAVHVGRLLFRRPRL